MNAHDNQADTLLPEIAQAKIGGISIQTVNARALHASLGVRRDFNQWMRDQIDRVRLQEERDYLSYEDVGNPRGGRPRREYALSLDAAKHIAMMSQTDRGFQVRDYFIECETRARQQSVLPDFSDPIATARAWADTEEGRQIALRTKAGIGSRREATAMNAASQAVKKATRLERELDRSRDYATVKRMANVYDRAFKWRDLKAACADLGIPPIDVFDANYGTVKAYHAKVWMHVYGVDVPRPKSVGGAA